MACVILLEGLMPKMDGFVFAEALHTDAAWRSIPIVVMTNKDGTTDDLQRLHGLADTVVRQSEDSGDELLTTVRDLLLAHAHPWSPQGAGHPATAANAAKRFAPSGPPPSSPVPRGAAASTARPALAWGDRAAAEQAASGIPTVRRQA